MSAPEHSNTDVGAEENGAVPLESLRPATAGTENGSTDVLVAQLPSDNTVVTVEDADPRSSGPRRRVTVQRKVSGLQRQSASSQQNYHGHDAAHFDGKTEKTGFRGAVHTHLGLLKSWCLELLALLLAAIVVGVIIGLLFWFRNRNVRSWSHGWAINSVSLCARIDVG